MATIHVSEELHRELKREALDEGVTLQELVRRRLGRRSAAVRPKVPSVEEVTAEVREKPAVREVSEKDLLRQMELSKKIQVAKGPERERLEKELRKLG